MAGKSRSARLASWSGKPCFDFQVYVHSATKLAIKISRDAATDESSMDSISFASLVCIHDQPKAPPPSKAANQDEDFEFCSVSLNTTKVGHRGCAQPNISASNGRARHKEYPFQSQQAPAVSPVNSRVLLEDYIGNKKSSHRKDGGRENHPKNGTQKEQRATNTDKRTSGSGQGQSLFSSLISPCRECQASNPAVKKPKKANKERSY